MFCEFCATEFAIPKNTSGGKNRTFCYTCIPGNLARSDRNKIRGQLLAKKAKTYKLTRGCSTCGYNKCTAALEWHHPEGDKLNNPSACITKGWTAYMKEVIKCTLLCANCHREAHHLNDEPS